MLNSLGTLHGISLTRHGKICQIDIFSLLTIVTLTHYFNTFLRVKENHIGNGFWCMVNKLKTPSKYRMNQI